MSIKLTFAKRREEYVNSLSYWDICYWENRPNLFDPNDNVAESLSKSTKKELESLIELAKLKNFMPKQDIWLYKVLAKRNCNNYATVLEEVLKSNYEDSFKCLILREYLDSVYIINGLNGKITYERHQRNVEDIDRGVMVLNADILKYIYFNAKEYTNFKTLYFDSQLQTKKDIIKQQIMLYADVNLNAKKSLNMNDMLLNLPEELTKRDCGVWIKFADANEDKKNYKQNAANVATLVNSTNSCLVRTSYDYLKAGPIYVYVDKNYLPQIRIMCYDNAIQEIRGLAGGQQIMPKYLDTAIEFLDKNNNVENANYFKIFIQNNKKALGYINALKKGELADQDMVNAKECLQNIDVQSVEGANEYAEKLSGLIEQQENSQNL